MLAVWKGFKPCLNDNLYDHLLEGDYLGVFEVATTCLGKNVATDQFLKFMEQIFTDHFDEGIVGLFTECVIKEESLSATIVNALFCLEHKFLNE